MSKFEEKVKPLLTYIGLTGAIMMSFAYIFVIIVLIRGFSAHTSINTLVFAAVNAIVGLLIANFLKYQGVSFAKAREDNQVISKAYYAAQTKDKKTHNMTYFWTTSIIKDILVKGVTFMTTTAGVIYIVIEGSNDWNLLSLAIVNLIMFVCFGLLSLGKGYDYYNDVFVPYMQEQLTNIKEINDESKPRTNSSLSN